MNSFGGDKLAGKPIAGADSCFWYGMKRPFRSTYPFP